MADGDGRSGIEQKVSSWFAYNGTAADDDGVLARDRGGCFDEMENSESGAWHKVGNFRSHRSDIDGVEAIDVFLWIDCCDNVLLADVLRQWKLDKDAMDLRISVDFFDEL